jgi:hypothetical protein
VPIGGGTAFEISRIKASLITPGPLGIAPTSPMADAPAPIAIRASFMLDMQQIFILGIMLFSKGFF